MQTTIPDSLLSRLGEVLAARIGLHYPPDRWADMERGIAAAASAFGMANAESCARRIVSGPLAQQEIEILAGYLTVGETYFFREQRSFEVLEQNILPALLQERAGGERRLRIWSAGCCTGEEAYSIAMLLDRMIPLNDAWNITLLATDINPSFLCKAVKGEYGEWSFRGTPQWIRDRYFRSGRAGQFRLNENIRQRVTFSSLNLADDVYPSLTSNTNAMDIIFCRNVLMYFSQERARKVIDNFHSSLVDGGWLIVSPAETSSVLFSQFVTVNLGGAILYRKCAGAVAAGLSALELPQENANGVPCFMPEGHDSVDTQCPVLPVAEIPPAAPARAGRLIPGAGLDPVVAARDCANQGRLIEAAEWCRKAIAADKLDPRHHYLLAIIQQELGQRSEAALSLMRALYLDPDFVVARYALGNLCHAQGKHREAERHLDSALAALRSHPAEETLPEADGLSAGRLMEIIMAMRMNAPQQIAQH